MKKAIVLFIGLSIIINPSFSQTNKSEKYYKDALKSFKNKDYTHADSLLRIADSYAHSKDIYVLMAKIDKIKGDTCGFCENLRFSRRYGNEELNNDFLLLCRDSIPYKDSINTYHRYCIKSKGGCLNLPYQNFYISKGDSIITAFKMLDSANRIDLHYYRSFPDITKNLNRIVFDVTDTRAEYPGGEKRLMMFVATNVEYPEAARHQKIQGTVYVSFMISESGKVSNIEILRSVHQTLDNATIQVVSQLKGWKPAKFNGIPVKSIFILPIKFALE